MEISQLIKNKELIINEISSMILRGTTKYNDYPLPSPQKTGTFYQKKTYCEIEARKLYSTIINDLNKCYE